MTAANAVTTTPAEPIAGTGLLSDEQTAAVLRGALGGAVTEAQVQAAVAALREAAQRGWDQLPPEISPDMGYNFQFLSCTETCWLGRQVLIEGATFRVFRQRSAA
jgi:hypothetical protein